jgi:hypothetical protein
MNPLRWLSVSLTLATAEAPTVLSQEEDFEILFEYATKINIMH